MKVINRTRNLGFVGIVFVVIIFVGLVIAAIAHMSREPLSNSVREKIRMDSALILKHGADFQLAIEKMVINGGSPIPTPRKGAGPIEFAEHPETNREVALTPPSAAASAENPRYTYGLTSGILVFRLLLQSKEHCQMINHLLGDPLTANPSSEMWSGGKTEGCYATPSNSHHYYKNIANQPASSGGGVIIPGRG